MLLASLLMVSAGCSYHLFTPAEVGGTPLSAASIEFLKKPATTRAEVIDYLGVPDFTLLDGRLLVYSWEIRTGYWEYTFHKVELYSRETHGRWALLIALDETNHIRRYETRRVNPTGAVEANATKWYQQASCK